MDNAFLEKSDRYAISDRGNNRTENEDGYLLSQNGHGHVLAMVCDGIGGASHGELASSLAVEMLQEQFLKAPDFKRDYEVDEWIRQSLSQINYAIFERAASFRSSRGMGTTAVGILLCPIGSYIFNIGDSRIYARYEDELIQMSQDHSIIEELIRQKKITREQANQLEPRNMLTNALGVWKIFKVDVDKIGSDYTQLLLCTDGLHGYVDEKIIDSLLKEPGSAKEKCEKLIDAANEAGGWDNCTAIVMEL